MKAKQFIEAINYLHDRWSAVVLNCLPRPSQIEIEILEYYRIPVKMPLDSRIDVPSGMPPELYLLAKLGDLTNFRPGPFTLHSELIVIDELTVTIGDYIGGEELRYYRLKQTIESYNFEFEASHLVALTDERFLDVVYATVEKHWQVVIWKFADTGIEPVLDDVYFQTLADSVERAGGCYGSRIFIDRTLI